jgi:hypothetical protein
MSPEIRMPHPTDHADAMTGRESEESVFVAGAATFKIRSSATASKRSISVTITRNDQLEWTYDQPAWRPLALGYGNGTAYLWSARAVIILPSEAGADPDVLDVDEDLLFVFKAEASWLLVCETSLRLLVGRDETSRIEMGEVIGHAYWDKGSLLVEDVSGTTLSMRISGERLIY